MFNSSEFTVTSAHLKLLRKMYVSWDDCEFGAPAIDCKRPYGNSYVVGDIAEILGWENEDGDELSEEQISNATALHAETETALQILLSNLSIEEGKYIGYGTQWRKL